MFDLVEGTVTSEGGGFTEFIADVEYDIHILVNGQDYTLAPYVRDQDILTVKGGDQLGSDDKISITGRNSEGAPSTISGPQGGRINHISTYEDNITWITTGAGTAALFMNTGKFKRVTDKGQSFTRLWSGTSAVPWSTAAYSNYYTV
ncbi:MAG: hypothetical protein ACJAWL_002682 [Motiliproteus sp.]